MRSNETQWLNRDSSVYSTPSQSSQRLYADLTDHGNSANGYKRCCGVPSSRRSRTSGHVRLITRPSRFSLHRPEAFLPLDKRTRASKARYDRGPVDRTSHGFPPLDSRERPWNTTVLRDQDLTLSRRLSLLKSGRRQKSTLSVPWANIRFPRYPSL
jgi:hypothetical protein